MFFQGHTTDGSKHKHKHNRKRPIAMQISAKPVSERICDEQNMEKRTTTCRRDSRKTLVCFEIVNLI